MRPPLVLLHGWGVNSLIWNRVLPDLEKAFELTLIDLPGYGNEVDYVGSYTLEAMVDEVLSRAPEQANWVGWSLGGTIAMAAAIAQPARFLKLQLVSTTARFLKTSNWEYGVGLKPFESLADAFDQDYEKAISKFLLLQLLTNDRAKIKNVRGMVRELSATLRLFGQPTSRTLRKGLRLLSETDLRARVPDLKVETQVIAGRTDQIVPVKASVHLFNELPNRHSLHVFETGHLPFHEDPGKYIETLTNFVNPINETC